MKLSAPLIYGLIACILLVSAPHAEHLPLWVVAVCSALLAWRVYLTHSGNPLPARWLLLSISVACVLAIAINFRTLFGREVGVTLLILLVTLKLLELRSVRDATVLIYLSCFIIITNFFYSQSIPTALFMLVTLLVIMATWVHLQTGALDIQAASAYRRHIVAASHPAVAHHLRAVPARAGAVVGHAAGCLRHQRFVRHHGAGQHEQAVAVRCGCIPRHLQRQSPLARTDCTGAGRYCGISTALPGSAAATPPCSAPRSPMRTQPVDYTVTLEPHNKLWLFALDMPTKLSIPADLAPDFQVLSRSPVNARTRYSASSLLNYRANLNEPPQQLQRALALPQGLQSARKAARRRMARTKQQARASNSYCTHLFQSTTVLSTHWNHRCSA